MTRTEILNKIDELETARFYLAMKDHWNREDFARDNELFKEIMTLKEMLNVEKTYIVEFIRPKEKDLAKRVIKNIATFKAIEEAKDFGRKYEEEHNAKATTYKDKGYYNITTIEIIL